MRLFPAFLALVIAAVPLASLADATSSGCGAEGWRSGNYSMEFEGVRRDFRVHVPKGYDRSAPSPLVTIFHGWNGNENEFLGHQSVRDLADERGYILVAPRGLGSAVEGEDPNSWTFRGSATGVDGEGGKVCDDSSTPVYSYASCESVSQNTCAWTQCLQNDVEFTLALVQHVEKSLCVDTSRVYATGGSNGGMFAWELGQNAVSAPTFKAIAPLIGLPHRGYLDAQGKPDDMPVLVITGTRDSVVPPGAWDDPAYTTTSNDNDRFYYTGATAISRGWAEAHGCEVNQDAVAFDAGISQVDCRTYCSGDSGWPRVLDCRAPMGHEYQLEWSWRLILDFFDQHSKPAQYQ